MTLPYSRSRGRHPHRRPAHDARRGARLPRPARPLAAARDRGRPGPVRLRLDRATSSSRPLLRGRLFLAFALVLAGAGDGLHRHSSGAGRGHAWRSGRSSCLRRGHREPARRRPAARSCRGGTGTSRRDSASVGASLRLEPDLHRPSLALEADRGPAGGVAAPRATGGRSCSPRVRRLPLDRRAPTASRRRAGRHLARHRPRPEPLGEPDRADKVSFTVRQVLALADPTCRPPASRSSGSSPDRPRSRCARHRPRRPMPTCRAAPPTR